MTQRLTTEPRSTLRRIALPSLTARISEALAGGGVEVAEDVYHRYKETHQRFTEIEVNVLGYQLLQRGKVDQAIAVFALNAESYPRSFNAWDSLAEGHKVAGHHERAIEHYRRSLELNPANRNAVEMLRELGAAP